MSIYIVIPVILLFAFVFYWLFKKSPLKQQFISEEDLKPFLEKIDLQQEKKVRKQWLFSFFAFTFISALVLFTIISPLGLIFGFITPLALIPWFWITYYCFYKKQGTVLLFLTLISIPMREILSLIRGDWAQAEWYSLEWFLTATYLCLEIFYWVNCLRLFKANSAREYQKVLAFKNKYGPDANGFCD